MKKLPASSQKSPVRTAAFNGVDRVSSSRSASLSTSCSPNALSPTASGVSRMNTATGTRMATDTTTSSSIAARQPIFTVSVAIAGMKMSCPVDVAAPNAPSTSPRCVRNQRCATVAPRTLPTAPVPTPTMTPQNAKNCQTSWSVSIASRPTATSEQPKRMTLRGPKRFTSVPDSGPPRPKVRMLTAIAAEIVARSHPYSRSSGVMRMPGAARTLDVTSSARNVIATTIHA